MKILGMALPWLRIPQNWQVPFHFIATGLGLVCLYLALFLYRDERDEIQNRLEDLWKNLHIRQVIALSIQVAFMQTVAERTSRLFDATFGKKYFTVRSFVVSVSLSMASATFAMAVIVSLIVGGFPGWSPEMEIIVASFVVFLGLAITLYFIPQLAERRIVLALVLLLALPEIFAILKSEQLHPHMNPTLWTMYVFLFAPLLLLMSFACDICFIAGTRWAVDFVSKTESFWKMFVLIASNIVLAVALVIFPFWWGGRSSPIVAEVIGPRGSNYVDPHVYVLMLSILNLVDGLVAAIFILLALLMIIHRMAWPALARPVFALADMGIVQHRKLTACLGLALLGVSAGKLPEVVKQLLDLFTTR
jgi:hypothetical protein